VRYSGRMRRQLFLLSLLVIVAAVNLVAEPSVGVIVYSEGYEVTILRDDTRIRLDAATGEAFGEPVYAFDQVTTGEDTSAEIQLLTGRNIVKIAENTTFTVAELGDGRSSLDVTYGRLRARVERLAGTSSFELRGMTASAGVRGTDFAYDQILDPVSGELHNRVSCLEGEVTVFATRRPDASATLAAGESVLVPAGAGPEEAVFEPVPEAVRRFWAERPFVRSPVAPGEILDEFPGVLERATQRLGARPHVGTPAGDEADATPIGSAAEQPAGSDAEGQPGVAEAPRVTERETAGGSGEDEGGGPGDAGDSDDAAARSSEKTERRERVARALRTTGVVLTGVGLVTDLVAIGLFYFGDDIFPGWTTTHNEYLRPVAIVGVGMLTGGLVSIVVSLTVSP
jgi:hypothetical protein